MHETLAGLLSTSARHIPVYSDLLAMSELFFYTSKERKKPSFGIVSTLCQGKPIQVQEKTICEKPFCRLLHFEKISPRTGCIPEPQPKVLLVAPLSGNHASLLRDMIAGLLPEHEVFITDWMDARTVPLSKGGFGLNDYVHYVCEFIEILGPDTHVVSISQSTVPVLSAVALLSASASASPPKTMTLIGGPIDARKSPTELNILAAEKKHSWFERWMIHSVPEIFAGAGRKVCPGFLQSAALKLLNSTWHIENYHGWYRSIKSGDKSSAKSYREYYDEIDAVLDMPSEYFLDTIKIVFQEFWLPLGKWEIDGRLVQPEKIKDVALLTVEGSQDQLVGYGQTHAALDICTGIPQSKKFRLTVNGCGHASLFTGIFWRNLICPKICEFIRQHDRDSDTRREFEADRVAVSAA
jgi:poly(3-hydroxybutyrate) depolymerase